MSTKDKWKAFGKNTGQAFKNFGKSVATTARVVIGEEERVNQDGKSTLKESWATTGKGFGKAGTSLGKAAQSTAEKVVGEEEEKEEKEETVIDVDVISEEDADPK